VSSGFRLSLYQMGVPLCGCRAGIRPRRCLVAVVHLLRVYDATLQGCDREEPVRSALRSCLPWVSRSSLVPVSIAPGIVAEKIIDGNPDNIHRRFNRKATPQRGTGFPKGMVTLRSNWIVPSKRMLSFCCNLTPA
jgi:hypothetical protein